MNIARTSMGRVWLVLAVLGLETGIAFAQTEEAAPTSVTYFLLHSFDSTDGSDPAVEVQAINGDLYGTARYGGANSNGTVFKITPGGTLTTLYSFCSQAGCTDGYGPIGLMQATNGYLYGTTSDGGTNRTCTSITGDQSCGTIFKMTPNGELTTLHNFDNTDGYGPNAGLVQAANGELYGTTAYGANAACYNGFPGCGTIFKITSQGLTTLHSFNGTDGSNPQAKLVQAANGDFYGTTWTGGTNGIVGGTVFKITPSGQLTTLYSFCPAYPCPDGYEPNGLVQGSNGDFYGTTFAGGANGFGTVFKITSSGTLTTLHDFNGVDGLNPTALMRATNGDLYGATQGGNNNNYGGTIFKITPTGTLTTLYNFCSASGCADGETPVAGLVEDTNGGGYGTASGGGDYACDGGQLGCGTIFALSVGEPPFVETRPTIGVMGETITIVGYGLKGATSVTFNGVPATILYDAPAVIYAKVPNGATTGKVQVVTPNRTLTSNVAFEVVP